MERKRVAVTGLGVLAANGTGRDAFWKSLCEARSGIGRVSLIDASRHPVDIAGEVKDFDFERFSKGKLPSKRVSRQTQLAIAGLHLAHADSGLPLEELARLTAPLCLSVGVSTTSLQIVEHSKEQLDQKGPARVPPHLIGFAQPNATAVALSKELGVPCQILTLSTACCAGLDAVLAAARVIETGQADVALAGGTDSLLTPLGLGGMWSCGLIAKWDGDPAQASRPFDLRRKAGVLSEGAAFLMLESEDHARARGAHVYLLLGGCGSSVDPDGGAPGTGFDSSMRQALGNTPCLPSDLDFICAHGSGDPVLDLQEALALKRVLGATATHIPTTSIKGCTGNPLSAAGPMALVACALAFEHDLIPPVANFQYPDPQCDLDVVSGQPRHIRARRGLLNLHGMGGLNLSVVVERAA